MQFFWKDDESESEEEEKKKKKKPGKKDVNDNVTGKKRKADDFATPNAKTPKTGKSGECLTHNGPHGMHCMDIAWPTVDTVAQKYRISIVFCLFACYWVVTILLLLILVGSDNQITNNFAPSKILGENCGGEGEIRMRGETMADVNRTKGGRVAFELPELVWTGKKKQAQCRWFLWASSYWLSLEYGGFSWPPKHCRCYEVICCSHRSVDSPVTLAVFTLSSWNWSRPVQEY